MKVRGVVTHVMPMETVSAEMNKYCNDKVKVYYKPKVGEIVFAKFSQGKVLCFIQASVRKIIVFCHL